ncbi:MAG: tetratricopeptide repeat protein, partial [Planctomycetaceae bacterium]|nr:tetratricopeptide repeat protein [Planctomycetaceae bacterium]
MLLRAIVLFALAGTLQDVPELRKSASEKMQKGDFAGAIQDFNRVLELSPKEWLMYYLRGESRKETGDLDGALADASKAMELEPTSAAACALRASVKFARKDTDGALQDYSEAIRRRPKEADYWVNRGAVKLARDDYRGTVEDCMKALELKPQEAVALQNLGTAQWKLKDFDAALATFTRSVELNPRWTDAVHMRGLMEYSLGYYDAALKDADLALKLGADHADVYFQRACCLMAKGRGKEAKADFDEALKRADSTWSYRIPAEGLRAAVPDLTEGPSTLPFARRLLTKGKELLAKGDLDKAVEVLEEALRTSPKSPEAFEAAAAAHLKRSDPNKGDRKRAKILVFDAVGLGKGLSPQMQRHLSAVESQVLAGLRWLAHHQMPDGRWKSDSALEACRKDATPKCDGRGKAGSDLRATALAVLAFQGASYSALSTDNYDTKPMGETVKAAQQWLVAQQKADGSFGDPASERFLED